MRWTRLVIGGAAVLTLAGCGASADTKAVPPTATGSLESLAAEARCTPKMQTDTDEIRQALCRNGDGRFVLATFATDRGQREWLDDAEDYGGCYLVGRKWVAVGDDGTVRALRGRLGGDVERGADHHAHGG
ncbi:hypothetical protein [Streptomyces sp. NK08204]|uniref:hypothetical protein n=1 Tax=Streptomyces sp. NK08204 TaxID=2873260 RepID=UPI001CEC70E6|nr:hypothetical protein [Streptomyces sp. NK08204]